MTQIPLPSTSSNPLAKHFRQPSLYIKLISGGQFWKSGSLVLPVTGEIPVYPMTTRDEITLRTPDALITGTSVVEVIQSCCPNIKNAWDMPSIDVDYLLIAIRIASYGHNMPITAKCPKCSEEHDYDIDLRKVLDQLLLPDYSSPLVLSDQHLTIYFKPLNYIQVSKANQTSFEEEKLIQVITSTSIDDDTRKLQFEKHLQNIVDLNIETAANSTLKIVTDDEVEVTAPAYIKEFYNNADSSVIRRIQESLAKISELLKIKPVDVACNSCGNQFPVAIEFDYSSFFGKGF